MIRDAFREFNFDDTLGRFEPVTSEYIRARIAESYREEFPTALGPDFVHTMRLTLSRGTGQAFFRANPRLPATERDFYLSKWFQFLYVVLEVRYRLGAEPEWETQVAIEAALDPNQEWLPESTNMPDVDWWAFYYDTRKYDLLTVLKRLPKHINTRLGEDTTYQETLAKSKSRRGPKPDMDRHREIAAIVWSHGTEWRSEGTLHEICEELDTKNVRVSPNWARWARSWVRALEVRKHAVTKAIQYSLDSLR